MLGSGSPLSQSSLSKVLLGLSGHTSSLRPMATRMQTPQVEVSKCCHAEIEEHLVGDETATKCTSCEKICDTEEVCEYCLGTGETTEMERVYPGEPHMAPIGTRKCMCQLRESDDNEGDR